MNYVQILIVYYILHILYDRLYEFSSKYLTLNSQKLPAACLSHSRGAAPKLNETPFVITVHGMNKFI